MKRFPFAVAAAIAALGLWAAGCEAAPGAPNAAAQDKAFGERVHAYLLAHPEVIEEAIETLQARQDAQKTAEATASIARHRQALEHDPRDVVAGNPDGKVTVVEFFDYRCPFCKAAEPDLERLLATHKDIRLVLKEFPILDVEDQSHISEDAARAALASVPQGKYWTIHRALFGVHSLNEDEIRRVLQANGVDLARDRSIADSKAITDHLEANHQLAHDIGVDGTPAFVVGDQMVSGDRMDDLESAIASAAKSRPAAGPAGSPPAPAPGVQPEAHASRPGA